MKIKVNNFFTSILFVSFCFFIPNSTKAILDGGEEQKEITHLLDLPNEIIEKILGQLVNSIFDEFQEKIDKEMNSFISEHPDAVEKLRNNLLNNGFDNDDARRILKNYMTCVSLVESGFWKEVCAGIFNKCNESLRRFASCSKKNRLLVEDSMNKGFFIKIFFERIFLPYCEVFCKMGECMIDGECIIDEDGGCLPFSREIIKNLSTFSKNFEEKIIKNKEMRCKFEESLIKSRKKKKNLGNLFERILMFGISEDPELEEFLKIIENIDVIDAVDENGDTYLHRAMRNRNNDLTSLLVLLGADENIANKNGENAKDLSNLWMRRANSGESDTEIFYSFENGRFEARKRPKKALAQRIFKFLFS